MTSVTSSLARCCFAQFRSVFSISSPISDAGFFACLATRAERRAEPNSSLPFQASVRPSEWKTKTSPDSRGIEISSYSMLSKSPSGTPGRMIGAAFFCAAR
jgi:hypothetical protein